MQDGDFLTLRAEACGTVRRERSLLLAELFVNVRPPREGVTFQCEAKSNDQLKLRSNLEQPLYFMEFVKRKNLVLSMEREHVFDRSNITKDGICLEGAKEFKPR